MISRTSEKEMERHNPWLNNNNNKYLYLMIFIFTAAIEFKIVGVRRRLKGIEDVD